MCAFIYKEIWAYTVEVIFFVMMSHLIVNTGLKPLWPLHLINNVSNFYYLYILIVFRGMFSNIQWLKFQILSKFISDRAYEVCFKMDLTQIKSWTIFHICFFITFLASSFMINIIQALLYVTVGLLNKSIYRTINSFFVWQIHAQVFIQRRYAQRIIKH